MRAHTMSIYFSLIPLVLLTASPPEKRHPDRMTEIEILEDIYVAQVASLFAGVVKNSVLPRWRSAAITKQQPTHNSSNLARVLMLRLNAHGLSINVSHKFNFFTFTHA